MAPARFVVFVALGFLLVGQPAAASLERLPPVESIPPGPRQVPPPAEEILPTAEPASRVKLWEGSFKLGLDGSEGNSQTFNFRFGLDAKRKTKQSVLSLDLDYHKSINDSLETAHRLFFDWRLERLHKTSPWSWFVHGTTVYDEFQPWDVRVGIDTGFGRQLFKNDTTSLLGRFGGGWSREIGGLDDAYVPELIFGLDFERQLSKRQKLTASGEYFPDVTKFGEYRIVTKAGWEVLLDEEMNLSLKLCIADRYNYPNPGGKLNDLDYSMILLWKF